MGRLLDIAKSIAGEKSLSGAFGRWILAVSGQGDQIPGMQAEITQLQVDVTSPGGAYLTQADWYVNSVTGNDANDGATALTAIQTQSELTRRFEARTIDPAVLTVTVNLAGTFTGPLALHCSGSPGTTIRVIGETPTQNAVGSITAAFVPFAPATNVDAKLTDATQTWAPLIGKRIRMTSGTNSGAITWLMKDLGANVVRVGQFTERATGKMKTPTNGDSYAVETLATVVPFFDVQIFGGARFYCKDVAFFPSTVYAAACARAVALLADLWNPSTCIFDGCEFMSTSTALKIEHSAVDLVACKSSKQVVFFHSEAVIFGHVHFTGGYFASQVGSRVINCGTSVAQGASAEYAAFDDAEFVTLFDATFTAASLGVFDNSSFPIEVSGQALMSFNFANALLFGSGNTAVNNVVVRAGNQLIYTTKPVITGTGNDSKIGGTVKAWGAIPYVETANNAMAVAFA